MSEEILIDRRQAMFGAGALVVGLAWTPARARAQTAPARLNAWVKIGADRVTILLSQSELGQGISTSLPAILADELGADWTRVEVENSPVGQDYQNPRLHWMFTGNSESIQSFSELMRQAGAAAREMLVGAAVDRIGGSRAADFRAENGRVTHVPTGRSFTFGELAEPASRRPLPANPRLRPDSDLRLVGHALPRRDIPAKTDGSAIFGIDLKLPGMVYAAIRQAPMIGGDVESFDPASVAGLPGVIGAFAIPQGVAVVAEHFWQAKTAVDALKVSFRGPSHAPVSSAAIEQQYRAALDADSWGTITDVGDAPAEIRRASSRETQDYWSPFQAHATMEPMNCTASVTRDGCDIWAPTQGQELTRIVGAAITKLPPENVRVHWTYSGGGFGRRLLADFVAQAVVLSMQVGRPVKVIWTREEDMTHDFYRPATLTRLTAALGAGGTPTAIAARLVSATQLQPVNPTPLPANIDPRCTEGLEGSRYAIGHFRLDYNRPELNVATSVLRTTGFGPNVFAIESFVDELAHKAGKDPYAYRRALLAHDPRGMKVLDTAAEKSGWSQPSPKGVGRGIAFYEAFDTIMAQVVELEVDARKAIRVRKIVTVADPGKVFDPGIGASNLEGGVVWGLTSVMNSEITFANGGVEQTNYDGYDMTHLSETARIVETHLIEGGGERIGGLGEVGPVGVPPAFANALFAATGDRIRSLPLRRHGYSFA